MDGIRSAIYEILEAENPATVRQTFYALVSRGLIGKSEREYKGTVVRLMTDMRISGQIPWGWVADNTRWMRKPSTFGSLGEYLEAGAAGYRRSLWADAPERVEIWLEKDALSGVLQSVTSEFDVPLMVTRGYPSITYLKDAAELISAHAFRGTSTQIYYFGDHDPSGCNIDITAERRLREFVDLDLQGSRLSSIDALTFQRVAVLRHQIEAFGLPTRPTKATDSRSKGFEGESVELDAISPTMLRQMCRSCIEPHIDLDLLSKLQQTEQLEREALSQFARHWNIGGGLS
ncbi:hypothetical protein KBY78_03675 [Synechococcus sp. EJ6-Ellesmere]|nr:hypothetical protein [Synechococcus sp. EJ6-Ellesmere]